VRIKDWVYDWTFRVSIKLTMVAILLERKLFSKDIKSMDDFCDFEEYEEITKKFEKKIIT
jgi:hypothetical protein